MTDVAYLEGVISIETAIRAGSRPIHAIYMEKGKRDRRWHQLRRTAESHAVTVEEVAADFIQAHSSGQSHGGVIAAVGPRHFVSLAELVAERERPFVVMLDGIEDPFNFGQAIRALYAAGIDGLVVRPRNWLSAAGIVARSSAGASEWMPTAVAETAEAAADFYRQQSLTVACTSQEEAISIYEADLTDGTFLLIGGERRGITRSFLAQADLRLHIPYGRPFTYSLGAAAATAILAFEVRRQRMFA